MVISDDTEHAETDAAATDANADVDGDKEESDVPDTTGSCVPPLPSSRVARGGYVTKSSVSFEEKGRGEEAVVDERRHHQRK